MLKRSSLGLAATALTGLFAMPAPSPELYRKVKPITDKNIGRNYLKYGSSKYMPHQGAQEKARRVSKMEASA